MYFMAKKHKCPKCNKTFTWSIHHDFLKLGIPYCIFCYMEFIDKNIPVGIEITKEC